MLTQAAINVKASLMLWLSTFHCKRVIHYEGDESKVQMKFSTRLYPASSSRLEEVRAEFMHDCFSSVDKCLLLDATLI